MIYPRLDDLLEHVGGSATRSCSWLRSGLVRSTTTTISWGGLGLEEAPPPLIESRSKNYLTMAMEEVASGKIRLLAPPA
jgi:DNA-directed RNA polymerase subunit omega